MKPQHSAPAARLYSRRSPEQDRYGRKSPPRRHLGVDVMLVAALAAASAPGRLGVAVYAGLWMILPTDALFAAAAPGLEAASRQGRRPTTASRLEDVGPLVALAAVALGVVVLVQSVVGSTVLFWPLLLGLLGLAVLWRQADEAQRERWADATGRIDRCAPCRCRGVASAPAPPGRAAAVASCRADSQAVSPRGTGRRGAMAGQPHPWAHGCSGAAASRERAGGAQPGARTSPPTCDSVLQTLALIQKLPTTAHGDRIARAQGATCGPGCAAMDAGTSVAGALRRGRCQVEDAHRVPVGGQSATYPRGEPALVPPRAGDGERRGLGRRAGRRPARAVTTGVFVRDQKSGSTAGRSPATA
jgi:hypothetical protein